MPAPVRETEDTFWLRPLAELAADLRADPSGLSGAEASARLIRHGPNVLRPHGQQALLVEFLLRFRNPLVIVLLVASGISALTGDAASFFIISAIVLMSVTLDFVQEHRAGRAAERLKKSVAVRVTVLRDGVPTEIPAERVVPGDVVMLAAGDLVPADGRVLESRDLFVNQALMTGEPYPVEKHPGDLTGNVGMAGAENAVFMGTSVISGSGRVLI